MQPAASVFQPFFFEAPGAPGAAAPGQKISLRGVRFDADPAIPFRGVCVLLNGQTEFIEKYFEVIDELRGRGFAVATMDWRGQRSEEHTSELQSRGLISYAVF